ncbi:flagellar basal body-associated protein FliL [Massilia solisilvae]|uniref:Flagellar protein FliL n=1 Tax=Massilia solisilvae TaxID=1811225 RepID=A0ABT2BEU4_9BURK|nr:flagellar basal body-associated protein FliL [Massilia solisilvae]MCS0607039.1 flagellar basal body-associated protein FliL [Massilia solisilvae]
MKANSKTKADPKDEAGSPNVKKKLIGIIAGAVLVLALGGGAGWYWVQSGSQPKEHAAAKAEPPEYIQLDPFTVNLQPENGDQYLQLQFTLQVPNAEAAEQIKANMPIVRNRVLLLLSGKHASEINTVDGKRQLASEIVASVKQPFVAKGPQQPVNDVLFTSFIIQ